MRKIFLFMMVTLDGFFEGIDHDLSWHHVDGEFNVFAAKQMQEAGVLLFGRRTYELMEGFWPNYDPDDEDNTIVRDQMDMMPKIVVSRTMKTVHETKDWQNATLLQTLDPKEITKLKEQKGKPIMVLASSQLCVGLLQLGLLDELRIMVNPVVIGKGTRLFDGIDKKLDLTLQGERKFGNGNILLTYNT
jgi:dihydrofolate reductase